MAAAFALLLFVGWKSWKAFQEDRAAKEGLRRDRLLWVADSLYAPPVDSFCMRLWPLDTLVRRDGLAWFAQRYELVARRRGRDDGWDWGCFNTRDSGIVVFLALDSGCATGGGKGLWSHACRMQRQSLDLRRGTSSGVRGASSHRSSWTFPGDARICPTPRRPDPPTDSAALDRCGP